MMTFVKGELKFFLNGKSLGVAAKNIPEKVYGIVDLYGKCAQVTLTPQSDPESKFIIIKVSILKILTSKYLYT